MVGLEPNHYYLAKEIHVFMQTHTHMHTHRGRQSDKGGADHNAAALIQEVPLNYL